MSIDFRIRDFCYPTRIWRLHRQFEQNQWLDRESLRAYQERRLATILKQAVTQVPYYRDRFSDLPGNIDDRLPLEVLDRLPLLEKRDLSNRFSELEAANSSVYDPRLYTTSGTLGEPIRFYLDRDANSLEFVYYWRHWSWGGFRLGDRFAELGSHFFLARPQLGDRVSYWQPHLRRLLLNDSHLSSGEVRLMADGIRRFRPRFLKGTASSLYFLAMTLQEAGIDDLKFEAVFSTGETLVPLYRRTIEETLHCRVLDSYGHMERTVAVSQCREGGYHVNSDYGILQLVETRPGREEGTIIGKVVGTGLHNLAMPLIRYVVGDEVETALEKEVCPCGRTLPLIRRVLGRTQDVVITPDGRYVTTLFLIPELVDGIRFIQFRQEIPAQLDILVVPNGKWDEQARLRVLNYVDRLVGPSIELRLEMAEDVDRLRDASGKLRVVVGYHPGDDQGESESPVGDEG